MFLMFIEVKETVSGEFMNNKTGENNQLIEELDRLKARVKELQKYEKRVKNLEEQLQEAKRNTNSSGKTISYDLSEILTQIPKKAGPAQQNLLDFQASSLAAILGLVNTRGGTVNIISKPGVETTFTIRLPATPLISRKKKENQSCSPNTILVVDDEEMIRNLGKDILEEAGYNVLTAEDGIEALEIFKRCRQDVVLVLLDITMPRMNGKDTFIKLLEVDPQLPVILSSGFDEKKFFQSFDGTKPSGYLKKPYSPNGLLAKIYHVLNS